MTKFEEIWQRLYQFCGAYQGFTDHFYPQKGLQKGLPKANFGSYTWQKILLGSQIRERWKGKIEHFMSFEEIWENKITFAYIT